MRWLNESILDKGENRGEKSIKAARENLKIAINVIFILIEFDNLILNLCH